MNSDTHRCHTSFLLDEVIRFNFSVHKFYMWFLWTIVYEWLRKLILTAILNGKNEVQKDIISVKNSRYDGIRQNE